MAKPETPSTRAPRGTKPVSQAFFTALDNVPEASRAAVAKAAYAMIKDEIKARREKIKIAAAKEKARKPATAKRAAKTAAQMAKGTSSPKRRPRKLGSAPASA